MKRNCLVLIFLFMLLLTASALALTADVTIKIDGRLPTDPAPQIYTGMDNRLELWITNSAHLVGMSLGLQLSGTCPFTLVAPYGNIPQGGGEIMQEHGTANNFLNTFGEGVLSASWNSVTGVFFMGGANATANRSKDLYEHLTPQLGYSIKVNLTGGPGGGNFDVRPIFVPPGGSWKMDAGLNVDSITHVASGFTNPNFQGLPSVDPLNPQGLARFVCGVQPCGGPVITGPGAQVKSSHTGYSFSFTKTDGEVSPSTWTPAPSVGSITSGGVYTLTPSPANQFCPQAVTNVIVRASNACPTTTEYPFTITWTNIDPVIDCPAPGDLQTTVGTALPVQLTAADDPNETQTWGWVGLPPTNATLTPGGLFTFKELVTAGTYTFTVMVTGACGLSDDCTFEVQAKKYNIVQIAKTGENPNFVFQGTYTHVPITLSSDELSLGGYNLLIHYDASALNFVSAEIGYPLRPCSHHQGASGWEYFTYRFGADGNCGGPCPSGMLRLVALAETNNGPYHPGCNPYVNPYNLMGEIADLKFYVTNDRTYECVYSEVGFAWIDCSDNSFSDTTGNKLYIAAEKAVHTFEWNKLNLDANLIPCEPFPNMTGVVYGGFCVPDCEANQSKPVYEMIYFMNGGVDIACADSIDARGDINLNGIANEIADAVLFTNFFIKGITAFYDDPSVCGTPLQCATRVQGKVAATDVNNDGRPLTVGDLVYLLRIIVGDALPIPKLSPFASGATVNFTNGSVATESGSEIGAVYATFAINGAYSVSSKTNMQVESGEVNGELKVLVYSGMSNLSNRIASGTNELFTVSGNVELKSVEVADYYGNMLSTRINKVSLPTSFALSQNVPNPFNPTTKLGFALPNQTEWTLSIYNVAGQLVKSFSGNNIGNVSVEWDASMASSGVYFYKLNAGSFSDTKKMVLMK